MKGAVDSVNDSVRVARRQCGLASKRVRAGERPARVIVSRVPGIEPCGVAGNRRVAISRLRGKVSGDLRVIRRAD